MAKTPSASARIPLDVTILSLADLFVVADNATALPRPDPDGAANVCPRRGLLLFSFSLGCLRLGGALSSEEVGLQGRYDHEQHHGADQHSPNDHGCERPLDLAADSGREGGGGEAGAGGKGR